MTGFEIVKKFEGLSLSSYRCPAGVWTIGYGSTRDKNGNPIKPNMKITKEQAEALLIRDFNACKDELKKDKNLSKLSENAIDALTSLCYNIGIGAFKRSKCYKAIVANDLETVCKEWDWFKANGKFMKGLARRRIAELGVFLENV